MYKDKTHKLPSVANKLGHQEKRLSQLHVCHIKYRQKSYSNKIDERKKKKHKGKDPNSNQHGRAHTYCYTTTSRKQSSAAQRLVPGADGGRGRATWMMDGSPAHHQP